MTQETAEPLPIPGAEALGRGIQLKPRQPYCLKNLLYAQADRRPYFSAQTQQTYFVPAGYEVNDSPPLPTGQALNHVVIEESFERFDKQFSLDVSLAASSGLFSIDASAGEASQVRSNESAYYAVRSSFIPFWTVYLPDVTVLPEGIFELEDVPAPFKHRHRKQYEQFFERYGTHYVRRVWVGGQAKLVFTIAKSSEMSKQDIHQGLQASVAGAGGAGVSARMQESKEKLQSHSECTVWGQGGTEESLAALSSLDETAYNNWLATTKDNPQIIELEVAGIWTLLHDANKAQALLDAYMAATTFTPISAAVRIDKEIYFLRGHHYLRYRIDDSETEKPRPINERWPMFAAAGFEWIDAAFATADTLYVFRESEYLRLDLATGELLEQRPLKIADGWPGVTFERIDAALSIGSDAIYFFQGKEYIRFDVAEGKAGEAYPEPISKRWVGVTFDRIDAAIYWPESGKAFFFRGDQHIRYDMVMFHADPGYPKAIVGSYVEDWKFFN